MKAWANLVVWVIGFVMLLLVLFIVFSFFAGKSRVTGVAEIGRMMDEACEEGYAAFNLSLPQKKPLLVYDGRETIGVDGDPRYVLYYERFPIGDSIPWDWLRRKDMPLVVYSVLNGTTSKNIEGYRKRLETKALEMFPDEAANGVEVVFINQVLRSDEANSSSKFMTCGNNMLCLKSGGRIRRYELKKCEGRGIDWVSIYSRRWRILRLIDVGDEDLDFSIASPCVEQVAAFVGKCKCNYIRMPVYDSDGNLVSYTTYCDNHNIFGTGVQRDVDCLKLHILPRYSLNYCFNREMSDKIVEEPGIMESMLSASGSVVISYIPAVAGTAIGAVAGGVGGFFVAGPPGAAAGAAAGKYIGLAIGSAASISLESIYEPPSSLRDECLVRMDDNSVAILPSCLDRIDAEASIDLDSISGIKSAMGVVKEIFSIEKNNAIWEVWPLNRPVVS